MFKRSIYQKIYKKIKKYYTIVIARHVGPDPDALGSSLGLKQAILNTFPNKNVYVVGCPASKFRYLGTLDNFSEEMYQDSLLIVLDTPDAKRVDGVNPHKFQDSIKIDHHPYVETFCQLEWIGEDYSSASEMVLELIFYSKLKMSLEAAEKLYVGLVADTDRFMFKTSNARTFANVSRLLKETDLDITKIYPHLYIRPLKEIQFQGYLARNLTVTEHGFGYVKLPQEILDEEHVDAATAGNAINNFNFIDEIVAWGFFSYDKTTGLIRGSLRSRGPVINEVAQEFGGGGHAMASGCRLHSFEEVDEMIKALDKVCEDYQEASK